MDFFFLPFFPFAVYYFSCCFSLLLASDKTCCPERRLLPCFSSPPFSSFPLTSTKLCPTRSPTANPRCIAIFSVVAQNCFRISIYILLEQTPIEVYLDFFLFSFFLSRNTRERRRRRHCRNRTRKFQSLAGLPKQMN
ncbi:hypothetical protein DFH11DRAFT_1046614 [Phellopilus nigrolimitatus]|nr:hypothetical protein DFH11DRAFT_1046614 [Phellopilus nigrolimitatus]